MTPAMRRILKRLIDGDTLVRDRYGWHLVTGIGRERVDGVLANSMIREGWIAPALRDRERAVYGIADAGRAALTEEETP